MPSKYMNLNHILVIKGPTLNPVVAHQNLAFCINFGLPNRGLAARAEAMAARAEKREKSGFGYCSWAARAVGGYRTCGTCPLERRVRPHVRPRSEKLISSVLHAQLSGIFRIFF